MFNKREPERRSSGIIMRLKLHYRLLAIVIVFGFTLYLLQRCISAWRLDDTTDPNPTMNKKVQGMHTSLLEFYGVDDPIDILWGRASSPEELKTLENRMVSVNVDTKDSLDQWLEAARSLHKVGLKVNFKNLHVLEPCLQHLYDVRNSIHFPVIIHGNVELRHTEDTDSPRTDIYNLPIFLFKLKMSYPNIRFSLGHVSTSASELVQMKYAETIQQHLQYFTQPVYMSVCASVVKNSWFPLRWLLQQSDTLSLIITSGSEEKSSCSNVDMYDLLYVRNDWHKERVFFDLPEVDLVHFRSTAVTAGSPLHYFNVADAAEVTWAHRVNSKKRLKEVLEGALMFLEADIINKESGDKTPVPIMAHPPEVSSDITFQEWLDVVATSGRGIKLDFKSIDSVEPTLRILASKHKTSPMKQPVWVNADILPGPNKDQNFLNASVFLKKVNDILPNVYISIGWVTKWDMDGNNDGYTQEMVETMNNAAKALRQPVTFPVRASLARKSWKHFDWLLKQSRGYSLTIWTSSTLAEAKMVSKDDMNFIRNNTEPSRVYFDLPAELMPV